MAAAAPNVAALLLQSVQELSRTELDTLICDLLLVGQPHRGLTKVVKEATLTKLCKSALEVLKDQDTMPELDGPVFICGDIHGQYGDLLRLFDRCGFPPDSNFLFLGDYVDRGPNSMESVSLLMAYKVRYPFNVFLLRGNHECRLVNQMYGFSEECIRRYSKECYLCYIEVFNWLPITALVGGRILCMHGGLSPKLNTLDQLRNLQRPCDPMGDCLEMDLLWADPLPDIVDFKPNLRGASFYFGESALNAKIQQLGIDLVVRAHQVVRDGFEFFGQRKLVTVFSASHYLGQFENSGAVMFVDQFLACSFILLKPHAGKPQQDLEIDTFIPERERVKPPEEKAASVVVEVKFDEQKAADARTAKDASGKDRKKQDPDQSAPKLKKKRTRGTEEKPPPEESEKEVDKKGKEDTSKYEKSKFDKLKAPNADKAKEEKSKPKEKDKDEKKGA